MFSSSMVCIMGNDCSMAVMVIENRVDVVIILLVVRLFLMIFFVVLNKFELEVLLVISLLFD